VVGSEATAGILAAMSDARPIGVIDSGVGGLTVLRELRRRLPTERLVYLADLAHFPYGPRYQHQVKAFALRIIEHLVERDVKLVVIACNTATAAALNAARERFPVPIVGVIAPGAQAAVQATRVGRVAVLSTQGTHESQEYVHAIKEANPAVGVLSKPAQELVEIVEAGEAESPRADRAVAAALEEVLAWGADVLLLGCTHFPLLRRAIRRVAGGRLRVVDSAETTAARVERVLRVNRLTADTDDGGAPRLLVTAAPERFSRAAALLFGEALPTPEVVHLWGEERARVVAL
jgi:glutamate racemase